MWYKIKHKLLGWDYIAWSAVGIYFGVARVHTTPDGKVFYWRYKVTKVYKIIEKESDVLWLTCNPDKYLKTRFESSKPI